MIRKIVFLTNTIALLCASSVWAGDDTTMKQFSILANSSPQSLSTSEMSEIHGKAIDAFVILGRAGDTGHMAAGIYINNDPHDVTAQKVVEFIYSL